VDRNINFCLAILKKEYSKRKDVLVKEELSSMRKSDALLDLETILGGIIRIECMFKEESK